MKPLPANFIYQMDVAPSLPNYFKTRFLQGFDYFFSRNYRELHFLPVYKHKLLINSLPLNQIMETKLLGFSVVVIPEGKTYSSWCPDVDVASQGDSVEQAIANLKEALELHLECMTPGELQEIRKRQGTRLTTTLDISLPA